MGNSSLSLLFSGIQSAYPGQSLTAVTTTNAGPYYTTSTNGFCVPPLKTNDFAPDTLLYICNGYTSTADIRVFSQDGTHRVTFGTTLVDFPKPIVAKEPLLIGNAQTSWYSTEFYSLSVLSTTYSSSLYSSGNSAVWTKAMLDDPGTTTVIVSDGQKIANMIVNPTTLGQSAPVSTGTASDAMMILFIPSISAVFLGTQSTSNPILSRSDFSLISRPGNLFSLITNFLVDSIDDRYIMLNSGNLAHYNRLNWLTYTDKAHPDIAVPSFSNNILNFGPYQFVIFIAAIKNPPNNIYQIHKKSFTIISQSLSIPAKLNPNSPHYGTLTGQSDKYFFGVSFTI